jgi:hypothetical protein
MSRFYLLIAGHARSAELTLVTNHVGEFSRVGGLRLENWTESPSLPRARPGRHSPSQSQK